MFINKLYLSANMLYILLYYVYNKYFTENFANSQSFPHEVWGVNGANQIYKEIKLLY
jgi:hypothetical protein